MKNKRRNDIVLVAVLLLLATAGLLLSGLLKTDGDTAVVIIDGKESARYPLDTDIEVVIETENGTNTLVISGGKAFVKVADCPDGICSSHRPVSKQSETIVCLPHSLVIKIESSAAEETLDIAV